ncbi:MAG: site-2 protease family protein [Proteobacteria bacterium]|nr:site-2 protease family protein [Pseudomonadota bacterium]
MSWIFTKFIVPLLVLGVLVLVHEFGHFIVAKWRKVGVLKFAVGFGPAILKFRKGETDYQIGIIPLGGFVRMVGDMPDPITGTQEHDEKVRMLESVSPEEKALLEDKSRWFIEKKVWERAAIVFAGPFFNLIMAILTVIFCVNLYGEPIPDDSATLGNVMIDSPGEQAGLKKGDLIKKIGDKEISSWSELAKTIHDGDGNTIRLLVTRDNAELTIDAQPKAKTVSTITGEKKTYYMLGISPSDKIFHKDSDFINAIKIGFIWTLDKALLSYEGIWGMIGGKISTDEIAGPIYILQTTGHKAEQSFEQLLYLTAILNVSLAVLNLLPIPILDGGHLFFYLLELIGIHLSVRKKEIAQNVGLVLLLSLMVFAVKNDLTRKTPIEGKPTANFNNVGEDAPKK